MHLGAASVEPDVGGRALNRLGGFGLPNRIKLRMPVPTVGSETASAKIRRQKGNNPDHQLRSLSIGQVGKAVGLQ